MASIGSFGAEITIYYGLGELQLNNGKYEMLTVHKLEKTALKTNNSKLNRTDILLRSMESYVDKIGGEKDIYEYFSVGELKKKLVKEPVIVVGVMDKNNQMKSLEEENFNIDSYNQVGLVMLSEEAFLIHGKDNPYPYFNAKDFVDKESATKAIQEFKKEHEIMPNDISEEEDQSDKGDEDSEPLQENQDLNNSDEDLEIFQENQQSKSLNQNSMPFQENKELNSSDEDLGSFQENKELSNRGQGLVYIQKGGAIFLIVLPLAVISILVIQKSKRKKIVKKGAAK